jgi:carbon storage regulator
MLVLTRKANQKIQIGADIVLTVIDVDRRGHVRIGLDAPDSTHILRSELIARDRREGRQSVYALPRAA